MASSSVLFLGTLNSLCTQYDLDSGDGITIECKEHREGGLDVIFQPDSGSLILRCHICRKFLAKVPVAS